MAAGGQLAAFAEALVDGEANAISAAIQDLRAAVGDDGWVDAAGVAATFNGIDRLADSTGIPLEDMKAEASADFRGAIGIEAFADGRG